MSALSDWANQQPLFRALACARFGLPTRIAQCEMGQWAVLGYTEDGTANGLFKLKLGVGNPNCIGSLSLNCETGRWE